MRRSKPQRSESPSKPLDDTTNVTVLVAVISAFVALVGASLTWWSSYNSTRFSQIQSCIQRIDLQEAEMRKIGERTFGHLGEFVGETMFAKDFTSVQQPAKDLVRSAFEITAYAPPELSYAALQVAYVVQQAATARDPVARQNAYENALTYTKNLPGQYRALMTSFDEKRAECKSVPL